jgi:acyl carrier protein
MSAEEIERRVRAAVAKALKCEVASLAHATFQPSLSNWDSVSHMNVILAVESEFDIEIDDKELPTLTTVSRIIAAVEKHTGSGSG